MYSGSVRLVWLTPFMMSCFMASDAFADDEIQINLSTIHGVVERGIGLQELRSELCVDLQEKNELRARLSTPLEIQSCKLSFSGLGLSSARVRLEANLLAKQVSQKTCVAGASPSFRLFNIEKTNSSSPVFSETFIGVNWLGQPSRHLLQRGDWFSFNTCQASKVSPLDRLQPLGETLNDETLIIDPSRVLIGFKEGRLLQKLLSSGQPREVARGLWYLAIKKEIEDRLGDNDFEVSFYVNNEYLGSKSMDMFFFLNHEQDLDYLHQIEEMLREGKIRVVRTF